MMLKRFGVKVPSMDSVLNFKVPGLDNFLPLQQVRSFNIIQMFLFFTLYFSELPVHIIKLSNEHYKFLLNYIYIYIIYTQFLFNIFQSYSDGHPFYWISPSRIVQLQLANPQVAMKLARYPEKTETLVEEMYQVYHDYN